MHFQRYSVAGVIFTLLAASPAAATITVYTDRQTWVATVGGKVAVVDFSRDAVANDETPFTTADGIGLSSPSNLPLTIQVLDGGLVNGTRELHFRDFAAGMAVTIPGNGFAFGFDYDTAVESWTIQVGDRAVVLPADSKGFVGYVDDAGPVGAFTLTGAAGAQGGISLDNLSTSDPAASAGVIHNLGLKYILEHLGAVPPPPELDAAIIAQARDYCASIGVDCTWVEIPARIPQDPRPLIAQMPGSRALRRRTEAVFSIIERRGEYPRNARALRRFERALDHVELRYERPLDATDTTRMSSIIAVARASNRFWSSEREGGLDGVRFLPNHAEFLDGLLAVIRADAEGCVAGMEIADRLHLPVGPENACGIGAFVYSAAEVGRQVTSF